MSNNGLIEYNWENPQHEKQYVLPMYVPGSAEFTNMNADVLRDHPEMGRFFERMSRLPLEKVTPMVPLGGAGIGMHVIPVEKAIEMENHSVSVEHISHWLDKYEGKYAASPCSCRRSRVTYDEGCADDPEGWCIAVGDMADYVVETNKGGRYITREEVYEILEQAEENGFVHQITNIDGENKIFLQYVTAMLTYVMHFVHHSYLIHQICLVQLMLPMLKRINVLPVDVALSSALPEQ